MNLLPRNYCVNLLLILISTNDVIQNQGRGIHNAGHFQRSHDAYFAGRNPF